jgi:hypothetical protein
MSRSFLILFSLLVAILEYGIYDHDATTIVAGAIVVTITWLLRYEIEFRERPRKGGDSESQA